MDDESQEIEGDDLEMSNVSSRLPSLSGVRYEANTFFTSTDKVVDLMNKTSLGYETSMNKLQRNRAESDAGIRVSIQNTPTEESKANPVRYPLVTIIGNSSDGKTSLVNRFIFNQFVTDSPPTVESDYYVAMVQRGETKENIIHILDTGSSVYSELNKKWMKNSDGFIITYSITNRSSFNDISKMVEEISAARQNKITPIVICATQLDKESKRKVPKEKGQELASYLRCKFLETSALTGQNVRKVFSYILSETVKLLALESYQLGEFSGGWLRRTEEAVISKSRFFLLTNHGIRYFDKKPSSINDTSCLRGIIPFYGMNAQSSPFTDNKNRKRGSTALKRLSFNGNSDPGFPNSIFLKSFEGKCFELTASNHKEKEEWLRFIQERIMQSSQVYYQIEQYA